MRLSWNEVRANAAAFAREWADARYERGETQSFYNDFFAVFGVKRRQVATFEEPVKKLGDRQGFIDLFWRGVLLVEQKSAGGNRVRAKAQALDYFPGLKPYELPRYVLVSDFRAFDLYDLESDGSADISFRLADLPDHVERFGFIMGVERRVFRDQDPANVIASELMAKVHDGLKASGYAGHDLERYLVRLLFCLFADDTGIFPRDAFHTLIEARTQEDGSDLGLWLAQLWEVLDTPRERRQTNLDEDLAQFDYINGQLFSQRLPIASFNRDLRGKLLEACAFRWQEISPAIFGSLFQGVMNAGERRKKGAHYTTEKNILKVIQPLFLDELRAEFDRLAARRDTRRNEALNDFIERLGRLTFFDPACGCGNFLVITYRELRRLETEALIARYRRGGLAATAERFDVGALTRLNVDNFHGIELEEFPARIAEVALWMTDHIENDRLSQEFGQAYARIPLRTAPHIVHGDALELDWSAVLPPHACNYVLGNPPFIGAKYQTAEQRAQVRRIADLGGSGGTLDYVAAWFIKAGRYAAVAAKGPPLPPGKPMTASEAERYARARTADLDLDGGPGRRPSPPGEGQTGEAGQGGGVGDSSPAEPAPRAEHLAPRIGFVATNSITQGEQVAQLWPLLFGRLRLEIAFAHRTFAWGSDARGTAHVHVVVIGLARRGQEPAEKRLFSYPDIRGDAEETRHPALTAYLFAASQVKDRHLVVKEVSAPLTPGVPKLIIGSKPIDGGWMIFSQEERDALALQEPAGVAFLRPYVGAIEYLNGGGRWIIAAQRATRADFRETPTIASRIRAVREYRQGRCPPRGKTEEDARPRGSSSTTLADTPTAYHVTVIPESNYLVIPKVSSERRSYVPIGELAPPTIPSDLVFVLADGSPWRFAVLTSAMHMSWLRHIGGRLKSDFRYSASLVYNTFPWPDAGLVARQAVERLAQAVLDARAEHPEATLADLYDPDLMPADLRRAHRALDEAVDRLYRPAPFSSDRERAEHLFGLYERLTAGLLAGPGKPKGARRRRAA